jgi:hypothetical protein
VTSSFFQVKERGFQDIADIQTESQAVLGSTKYRNLQRYFWAGSGLGFDTLKGINLKETIQTCG